MRKGHTRPGDDEEVRLLAQLAGHRLHIGRGVAKEKGAALRQQALTNRTGQGRIVEQALGNDEMLYGSRHENNEQLAINNEQWTMTNGEQPTANNEQPTTKWIVHRLNRQANCALARLAVDFSF